MKEKSRLTEFDLIKHYFAIQVDQNKGVVLGIGDDCAILDIPLGYQLAVTTDTLVADVHFFDDVDPYLLGYKSLAVNLSDLAAMGAEPKWFSLAITLPDVDLAWLSKYTQGLFDLAKQHNVSLVGGDTTKGPLSITISAKGIVKSGRFLTRSGALEGDLIVVSGNIGDGAIGLALKRKQIKLPLPLSFIESLQKTEPRCKLGLLLTNKKHKASSCLDISDGLIQDLMHILTNSNCGASINIDQLPLSAPHQAMLALDKIAALDSAKYALFGGDDYELLFTISKENFEHLTSLNTDTQLTVIGEITTSKRAKVIFESEQNNEIAQLLNKNRHQAGWDHFAI